MHIDYIAPVNTEKTEKSTEKILRFMKLNTQITIKELAEQLRLSTSAIEKNIVKLKSDGTIERIGGDKGGHWKVTE